MKKLKQLSSWVAKKLSLKTVNNHSTVQLFNHSTARKTAFTLAEVLITITIIGVVAALTIPNLMEDVNQRKYNAASGNFQRKLGEALRVMNAQNTLKGYNDTKDFVAELQKNMKILKVCNTVTDCFPAKFKKGSGIVVETSTLTDAASLGQSYGTKTVGVQFADGIRAIIAYNPDYTLQSNGNVVSFTKDDKNIVSMNTNVLSMVFDVSEDDNNKINEDIFIKNTNFGSSGPCDGVKIGDYCVKDFGTDYDYIDCSSTINTPITLKYCGKGTSATDYWAGAKKKCEDEEMKLPDVATLSSIYNTGKKVGGTPRSGMYWASSDNGNGFGHCMEFSEGTTYTGNNQEKSRHLSALCVGY